MATATSRVLDIRLINGRIRLIQRDEQTMIGYVYHTNTPLWFVNNPISFDLLEGAINVPHAEQSKATVREFVMSLDYHNASFLGAENPNRFAQFGRALTAAEKRILNEVQPLDFGDAPTSRIEQFKQDLREGVVFVLFRKVTDQTIRPMVCTLNPELIARYEGNNYTERPQRGRPKPSLLTVYDLSIQGWRQCYVDNILAMDNPEAAPYLHQGMVGKSSHNVMWFTIRKDDAFIGLLGGAIETFLSAQFGEAINPRPVTQVTRIPHAVNAYSIEDMLSVLESRVVRMVFQKKGDASTRIMYGTRNPSLLQTYEKIGTVNTDIDEGLSPAEKRAKMIEDRMITVFDLEIQEFRKCTIDNLLASDPAYADVPSWVEYDVEIGDWFATMRGTKPVSETYSGSGFAGKDMLRIDKERLQFEAQLYKYQTIKADVEYQNMQDSSHIARLQESQAFLATALSLVTKADYTSQDLEVFDIFRSFAEQLESDFKSKVQAGTVNHRVVFSEQKALKTTNLVILSMNWGRDVYYIHPRFVIGATSHKVYADRIGVFTEGLRRAQLSDTDKLLNPILEDKLAPLVTGRRRQDLFTKPVDNESDARRVRRIQQLVKENAAELKARNISFVQNRNLPAQFKIMIDRKQFALVNHEYVYDLRTKKFMFTRTKEITYANTLEPLIHACTSPEEKAALTLILTACDLRRNVKNDNGDAI